MRLNLAPYLILLLLIGGCAQQTTPTGGEKDTIPPKLVESTPKDRKTNFSGNSMELVFDEQVQIVNAREQILITPSIGKKFEATARKNKVTLKLNSELLQNTTYTISFRESIQDLTEKNPAENLKLAFSTGNYIDSLSIQGVVYDLLKGKPLKNFTVAAYPYSDTLNIFKHDAKWITLTNEKGEYILDNLKGGDYLICAFDDKNKNLFVDSKSEQYGFIESAVSLSSNIKNMDIPTIRLDTRDLKLISAKPLSSYFNVRLSKGISSYSLKSDNSDHTISSIKEDAATIKVYNTLPGMDSLLLRFTAKDSIDNSIDTLFYLKFNPVSTNREKFSTKLDDVIFHSNSSTLQASVSYNKPIATLLFDSVFIQLDSVNRINFSREDFRWDNNENKLRVVKTLPKGIDFTNQPTTKRREKLSAENKAEEEPKEKKVLYNQLIFPKSSFISVDQDTSAIMQSAINTITPENSGVILIEVDTKESIIVEVVDQSDKVVTTSTNPKSRFDNLKPGSYKIRVTLDKNGNGQWDPGNYFKKIPPEPMIFYKNEKEDQNVNIKANWELGPLLITPQ